MKRRDFLRAAALGLAAGAAPTGASASGAPDARSGARGPSSSPAPSPLHPPARGSVPVAFLVSDGAVVIDFCGPWEVFQDVNVPGRADEPFRLFTVAETKKPIRASGGLTIVPDFDLASAPEPKVIVIPAQSGRSEAVLEWVRRSARSADVTMSVCTGAFLLARTGLLSGKSATTHHSAYGTFAMEFPGVKMRRGARFVEEGSLATAGGLSSGIDLALRVVERYYGHDVALQTAYMMEYQGRGWLDAASNAEYARPPAARPGHPLCPVCWMEVDPTTAPKSVRGGKTFFFCMPAHQQAFDAAPDAFLE